MNSSFTKVLKKSNKRGFKMKGIVLILFAILVSFTSPALALEDIELENFNSYTVGSSGYFGNPALKYASFGDEVTNAVISGDTLDNYIDLTFDGTAGTGARFFGLGQRNEFLYPLNMSLGASISFDLKAIGISDGGDPGSNSIALCITPEIKARTYDGDGNLIQYENWRLPDAELLALTDTDWTTLSFDVEDLHHPSAGASAWKVFGPDVVLSVGILFTNIDAGSGQVLIDNLNVYDVEVIPEPATILLLLGAVVGLIRKRLK